MIKLFDYEAKNDDSKEVFVPYHNIAFIRKQTIKGKEMTLVVLKYGYGNRVAFLCTNDFEILTKQITEDIRDKRN